MAVRLIAFFCCVRATGHCGNGGCVPEESEGPRQDKQDSQRNRRAVVEATTQVGGLTRGRGRGAAVSSGNSIEPSRRSEYFVENFCRGWLRVKNCYLDYYYCVGATKPIDLLVIHCIEVKGLSVVQVTTGV